MPRPKCVTPMKAESIYLSIAMKAAGYGEESHGWRRQKIGLAKKCQSSTGDKSGLTGADIHKVTIILSRT